ncbi:MAG: ISL3 family transposase [Ktedonobacterales bacterium]
MGNEFQIKRVTCTPTALLVEVVSAAVSVRCPLCQHVAWRRHSCYTRRIADLPCAGQHVLLAVTVRKFFCQNPACLRQIFTERLPQLVQPSARKTNRLLTVLSALGLAAGGETGTRLAAKLGIQTSPSTILRYLMRLPLPAMPPIRILGVDDWSWKKGRRYGTILVDLERHAVVDLLEDRCRSTFAEWLHAHPEVEIISRDRATEYAAAAREAAPHAGPDCGSVPFSPQSGGCAGAPPGSLPCRCPADDVLCRAGI